MFLNLIGKIRLQKSYRRMVNHILGMAIFFKNRSFFLNWLYQRKEISCNLLWVLQVFQLKQAYIPLPIRREVGTRPFRSRSPASPAAPPWGSASSPLLSVIHINNRRNCSSLKRRGPSGDWSRQGTTEGQKPSVNISAGNVSYKEVCFAVLTQLR